MLACPASRARPHWDRALVAFLQGVRAALDECIAGVERLARRRETGRVERIRVR